MHFPPCFLNMYFCPRLNNRKARLARAAREARAPSEGETAYTDKTCGPSTNNFYESPDRSSEEPYIPPSGTSTLGPQSLSKCSRPSGGGEDHKTSHPQSDLIDFSSQHGVQNRSSRAADLKSGQLVMAVDVEGKEVGRGKVFQVEGRWQGKNLEDVGVCIVDITDLKVDRSKEVQYPLDGGGRTFEEAVARNGGVARVAWDVVRVHQLPH